MVARCYVDSITKTVALPILSSYSGSIYHQDNTGSHTKWFSQRCLKEYEVLLHTARSQNISLTFNVWELMGRQQHLIRNTDKLTGKL